VVPKGVSWWSGVSSTTSIAAGLNGKHVMMDARMAEVLCGADGRPGKIIALILLEDGLMEDGGMSLCNGVHSGFGGPDCVPNSMFGLLMSNKAPII
jgi:hypothetical protein